MKGKTKKKKIPGLNSRGETPSKVDQWSGQHTTSIIVGALIALALIGLIVLLCVKNISENTLLAAVTGIVGIMGTLVGYFLYVLKKP